MPLTQMSSFDHLLICCVLCIFMSVSLSISILFHSLLQRAVTKNKNILYAAHKRSTVVKLRRLEHWFGSVTNPRGWVECVLHTQSLGICPQHSIKVHAYSTNTQWVKAEWSEAQGYLWLCRELKTSSNKQEKLISSPLWFWLPSAYASFW